MPDGVPHRWGFQVVREIKERNAENIVWAPMTRDQRTLHQRAWRVLAPLLLLALGVAVFLGQEYPAQPPVPAEGAP